jgi:ABC-type multidrug transport system fused ATPase/permease subunit
MFVFGAQVKNATISKMGVVRKMSGVVEESLFAIKLIASFANEDKEIRKFEALANETLKVSRKQHFWSSFIVGAFKMFIFGYFCYAFYISTLFIEKKFGNPANSYKPYTVGDLLAVFIAFNMGMMQLFGLSPNLQALIKAKVVGYSIFEVIDRVPEIRDHDNCTDIFEIKDGINFENVAFRYPTAPEKVRNVFDSVSFKIRSGETTAIVGPSGSGKSTIVQMIERYY